MTLSIHAPYLVVHTEYNIRVYLPDMLLKVPSVLQDVPDLLISVLVTVTQPTEDGEVLYRGSHMLAAVAESLPAQVGHHELLLRQLLHAMSDFQI